MANPKTTNLNLNKVDRSSPTTTTFNTKPLIDDNMDIIDGKFGATTGHGHTGVAGDGPKIGSTGLANGAATDTVIGNRTADPNTGTAYSLTGSITQLFSWVLKYFKAITGKANPFDAPDITLAATKTHVDDNTRHITAAERTAWNAKADQSVTYTKTETDQRIQTVVGAAPAALDTLKEIGDALNNDPSFAATMTTQLSNKVDKVAGKQLSTEDYTTTEKNKLAGIATGANNYVHPASHPATMITEDSTHRWTTDSEKSVWNAKETTSGAQAKANTAESNAKSYTDSKTGRVDLSQSLGPGLSVVTADQNGSDLDLVVNGRTLVNILGNYGGGESLTGFTAYAATTVSNTRVRSGSNSIKLAPAGGSAGMYKDFYTPLDAAKQYLLSAWIYIESYTSGPADLTLRDVGSTTGRYTASPDTSKIGVWQHVYVKVPTSNTLVGSGFRLQFGTNAATLTYTAYIDEIRLYEISAAEYTAVGSTITGDQVDAYFPYVDGKQHVQGVAITKQGRNLLPWQPDSLHANAKMNGPYDMTLTATAASQNSPLEVDVIPGQTYTISAELTGANALIGFQFFNASGASVSSYGNWLSATGNFTFVVPANASRVRVQFNSNGSGTLTFKNWQLELGSAATEFTPAELQTVVLPVTLGEVGGLKDSVYSAGTGWQYVERVKKDFIIDGSFPWNSVTDGAGFKYVVALIPTLIPTRTLRLLRYDNVLVPYEVSGMASNLSAGEYLINSANNLYVGIADTDSGWIESLNPNGQAIKAFFNGWKANANNGTVYTSWVSVLDGSAPSTNTEAWVAANKAPGWTAWASLDYALGSATAPMPVENAEGSITLHPGKNQISVETGVIQREPVTPIWNATSSVWEINRSGSYSASQTSKRVAKFLELYADEEPLPDVWVVIAMGGLDTANGTRTNIQPAYYDPNADYYVTYIALDKYALTSNVTETIATYRTGLGGVASDLVQSVAELRQDNDRQNFADDYIEAKADNLRIDLDAHSADTTRHITAAERSAWNSRMVATTLSGTVDLNTAITAGVYRLVGSGMTNHPNSNYYYGQMLVLHAPGTDTIAQIIFPYIAASGPMYRRGNPSDVGGAGGWSPWLKLWTEENDGTGSGLDADLFDGKESALFALLASPAFTGTPTAPTAATGTNTTQIATTAFVRAAIAALVDSSPATLDTLNELAAALGDDPNFATTVTNALAGKLDKNASQIWVNPQTAYGATSSLTLPIGDSDTGIKWVSDGQLDFYSNNNFAFQLKDGWSYFRNSGNGLTSLSELAKFVGGTGERPATRACRNTSEQTLTASAWNTIVYNFVDANALNALNTGSGVYFVQQSGWYLIVPRVVVASVNASANFILRTLVNGTFGHGLDNRIQHMEFDMTLTGSQLINLNAGDNVAVQVYASVSENVRTGMDNTRLEIIRVA
ncbi:pyocin knob domain-containing protein [Paenibacillus apii]|uniref:pyocin knob domain-containing protein n=1 Tax=Paenibacillus apii TaxID=1850370 RepID=UPI001981D9B5|nr:hypothetical protein [Paenibacillus apii]